MDNEKTPVAEITDQHALEASNILGGQSHLSDESKVSQFRQLFCTNKLYSAQTNIPGIYWYRVFKFLESLNYQIETNE